MKNALKYVGMYVLLLVLPFLLLGLLSGFIQKPGDITELISDRLFYIFYMLYASLMLLVVLVEWNLCRKN